MSGLRARWAQVPADVRLLLGILAILLPFFLLRAANTRWMGIDGGYYAEVARHVRDGFGLATHQSLYHAGYTSFPHPSPIYPLWPLLLGTSARLIDLEWLCHFLPVTLCFTALVAAFAFGRRLWPQPLLPELLPSFHAGHLLVLLLGLQRDFIAYSNVPYTEPLGWTLLFLFFRRLLVATPGLTRGLELGVWACLAYFTRAQLIIVPLALLLAQGSRVLTGPRRGRALGELAVSGAVITGALGAYLAWLSTFVHQAGLSALLRFDQNRASDLLTPFDVIVDKPALVDVILDRASGLVAGWDLLSDESYQAVFYATHWALPLSLPFLGLAAWDALRARRAPELWRGLQGERALAWCTLLAVAAGGLLSVQLAHKHFNGEWYFDRRQSMICTLAFFLPMAWMLRQRDAVPRALARGLLGISVALGGVQLIHLGLSEKGDLSPRDRYGELVRWLKQQSADAPISVVLQAGKSQRMGYRTGKVGYHWFYNETSYADLLAMTDTLGARTVIFEEKATRRWRFRREGAGSLERDFETLPERPDGFTILRRRDQPPPAVQPPKVVVVGVDGASWKVIGPMIARGELPTFERLGVEGASEHNFSTLEITRSPVIWTSVATGQPPEVHGVTDYTQEIPGVGKVPVTSLARKVPALWNLASDAHRDVLVINWWASWPAETVQGQIVSDHANPAAAGWMQGRYYDADTAMLQALHQDTWPADLADDLKRYWVDPARFPLTALQAQADLSLAQLQLVNSAQYNQRETYSWLKTFYAVDQPHLTIALDALRQDQPDLTMLYLRGPDPVQHYAWDTVEPERYLTPPPHLDRDRGVVQGVYRYVDHFLAEILDAAGPDSLVIVLSDHGAEPSENALRKNRKGRPGGHTQDAPGVLYLWGPDIRRGAAIEGAGPLDIAPTVAWALGLPVADDLPGRVLSEAFTLDFREGRGRERTPTWGVREAGGLPTVSPADATMMEQLRGLGYIE